MTGHACLQSTSYFFPALTLLTFWVTFCVTFHLTNTGLAPFFVAGRVFLPFTRPYIERGIYYAVYL